MLPKRFIRKELLAAEVLRYALAPACVLLAALVHLSPAGSLFPPAAFFVFAVLVGAWFGGPGPGFLTAALGALTLPQLTAVGYPLLGGYLDLPRFIAFSVIGFAVGWGSSRRRRKLREQERYARAMESSDDGFWDWIPATDTVYASPRLLEIYGFSPGTTFNGRDDLVRSIPFHPEDRLQLASATAEHFACKRARLDIQVRFTRDRETRWVHVAAVALRDSSGAVVRWTGTVRDITGQKRVEDALRLSEERHARAMEGSDSGHWDWNILTDELFVSERAREMLALPSGTLPRTRTEFMKLMAPHHQVSMKTGTDAAIRGASYENEYRIVPRDGPVRWLRSRGKVFRDASGVAVRMAGSVIDITESKQAEEALRESESRYELAMAASESGYWDWDIRTDRYVFSPRAYEIGGYDPGTWANRDDFRARNNMHPEDFARWEAAREKLFAGTGERLAMEVRYIIRGETRWHSLQGICRRDDTGKVVRWTGSTTDITERKRAEEGLTTMERKLRQAQRLEAMGTLAGGIAHDFNNILGAVLGYGEMALRDAPKGRRLARDLGNIMIAGERGRALVDRVLAFSRNAVGERVPVHVAGVVREVLDLVSAKLPSSVTVQAKLHAGSAAVLGDATQVHQVVANLANNAIHAMPTGGTLRVELAVEPVKVPRAATIGGRGAGEYVVLTVADTGTGIAPEIVERIFDPFFTTKEVGTGTGLGLSLVHGIVTELGGAIDVASTVGTGSTFTVYLPRSGNAAERSDEKRSALPRGGGQRVLIVDDEEPLVQLAIRTLEDLGYVPVGFTSSAAALAAFRADPGRFDALITDERMPEMSGSVLIREVRDIRSSMPVVLMSGYLAATARKAREGSLVDIAGGEEAALAIGADEVLQKPVSTRDLATSLARVFRL